MNFNNQNLNEIRDELNAVLKKYGDEKGLQFKLGGFRYDSISFTTSLKVTAAESQEEAERIEWEKLAPLFGLEKDDYGLVIDMYGEKVKLVKVKPKAKSYPLVGEKVSNGKRYKYHLNEYVRKEIEKKRSKE